MTSLTGQAGFTPQGITGLNKTGYKAVNIPVDPRTQQLWQMLMGGAQPGIGGGLDFLSKLAGGGDEEFWKQTEAPAFRQFNQLQGQLASRFSGQGMGSRRSSGFQNASQGASADLAERLQAGRMGLQQNAIQQLMSLSQNLLGTPLSQTHLAQKQKPFWQELLTSLAGPALQAGVGFGTGAMNNTALMKLMKMFQGGQEGGP